MMPYDQALKLWGAKKIDKRNNWEYNYYSYITKPREPCDPNTVTIRFEHDTDDCETCGYDYAQVLIKGDTGKVTIDADEFSFANVLRELIEIGGGGLTV